MPEKDGSRSINICLINEWGRLGSGNMYLATALSTSISLPVSVFVSVFASRSRSVSIF